METRTVHDPFIGKDVQISNRLVDRLRGKYASGPHLPNGKPEFGWKQFEAPPIQHDAAARIEELEEALRVVRQAIIDKAEDTFWLSEIETVVDRIEGVLGGYADAQTDFRI